jgi:antitoxin PrlF
MTSARTGSSRAATASPAIEEIGTITAKGQTTVPKVVRQSLGIGYGGKIAYRIEGGRVTLRNPDAENIDPVLAAFLDVLAGDIAKGNLRGLPRHVAAAMARARKAAGRVNLEQALEGDVAL